MTVVPLEPWQQSVASQAAGAVSTLCFYPLDVIKTRYMAQDGTAARQHNGLRYNSLPSAFRAILRDEGLGALYRGAHVAVFASAASWGMYMYVYRELERGMLDAAGPSPAPHVVWYASLGASVTGNVCVAMLANPLWLVKSRMQLEDSAGRAQSTARGTPREYASVLQSWKTAIRKDGVRSLWRGASAQLLVGVPNAATFPVYDATKRTLKRSRGTDVLSLSDVCACSAVAKSLGCVLCHPFVLVKVRLQDAKRSADASVRYESLWGTFATIAKREGPHGFFRGLTPALLQTMPRGVMQFALYELAVSSLHRKTT
jgi:solute carrier family 25 folate transporter 32